MKKHFSSSSPPQWTVKQNDLFPLFPCSLGSRFYMFLLFKKANNNKVLGLDFTEGSCEMRWLDKLCAWRLKAGEYSYLPWVPKWPKKDGRILDSCPLHHMYTIWTRELWKTKSAICMDRRMKPGDVEHPKNTPEIFVQDFIFLELIIPSY